MEMWCPDDTGAGKLGLGWAIYLGESMLQLPRVGVEAPRLLKRSLPRLYCCCCCSSCFVVWDTVESVCMYTRITRHVQASRYFNPCRPGPGTNRTAFQITLIAPPPFAINTGDTRVPRTSHTRTSMHTQTHKVCWGFLFSRIRFLPGPETPTQ